MSKIKDIEKLKTQQHKLPPINRSKYGKRGGLEGPFMTKSGKVVYYDKSKGRYLDPDKDMYLSYNDWKALGEEAPANATGSAVAGTGDDSSTVVVKKKKPMQDKLMRRFGIQETINRVIPDLEYEEDEITKRTNQLKEMASKKYVGYEDAINASIKTTEKRENWLKDLAINADKKLPYDKDTDQPKKYVAGLSDKEKKSHDRHLEKQGKKSDSDKSAYKQSPADKVAKTKTSVHTTKYKQMFGEEIKGLKNKAEKSGMPYSILKQVYDRGMAAWKGGHRPGTTPQQWAFARVNSFITKSSGTWGKADADLAKKVRGS
ncbi:MAG: hypothetical protein H8D92_01830 [Pelagibacteraceae bacterium]|nr:hypothetical protein [Pelagibacteraceae bacterium]